MVHPLTLTYSDCPYARTWGGSQFPSLLLTTIDNPYTKTLFDAVKPPFRPLSRETDDSVHLAGRDLFPHELSRDDMTQLHGNQRAITDLSSINMAIKCAVQHDAHLDARQVRKCKDPVVSLFEILHHRHRPAFPESEPVAPCTCFRNPFQNTRRLAQLSVWHDGHYAHSIEEVLQSHTLSRREHSTRKQAFVDLPVVGREKLSRKRDDWPGLEHGCRRNVDVDQHFADAGSDRLEIASPQNETVTEIRCLPVREKRPDVERIGQAGLHPNDDVQSLCATRH